MNITSLVNVAKLAGGVTSVGLSPGVIAAIAGGAIFALTVAFGAGMIVEARWSTNLLITRAEQAKDKAIAELNKKVAEQQAAAVNDAKERAAREAELKTQVDELLAGAEQSATTTVILPENLVDAIGRAGSGINRKK